MLKVSQSIDKSRNSCFRGVYNITVPETRPEELLVWNLFSVAQVALA